MKKKIVCYSHNLINREIVAPSTKFSQNDATYATNRSTNQRALSFCKQGNVILLLTPRVTRKWVKMKVVVSCQTLLWHPEPPSTFLDGLKWCNSGHNDYIAPNEGFSLGLSDSNLPRMTSWQMQAAAVSACALCQNINKECMLPIPGI